MNALLVLLHPGHGHTDPSGWLHYLTEPLHVATIGGAVVAAITVGTLAWRRLRRRT